MTDPGLQPERTSLSWQRTALSAAVAGLLLLKHALQGSHPWQLVVTGLYLVLAAGCQLWALTPRIGHALAATRVTTALAVLAGTGTVVALLTER